MRGVHIWPVGDRRILMAAPIGNTTVLLLFSLSLECLLALMLFRERQWRLLRAYAGRRPYRDAISAAGANRAPYAGSPLRGLAQVCDKPRPRSPLAKGLERGHITGPEHKTAPQLRGGEACIRGRIIAVGCRL